LTHSNPIFSKKVIPSSNWPKKLAMKNFEVVSTEELKNIKGGMQDKAILDDCLV